MKPPRYISYTTAVQAPIHDLLFDSGQSPWLGMIADEGASLAGFTATTASLFPFCTLAGLNH